MSCIHLEISRLAIDLAGPKPRRLIDDLSLRVEGGRVLAVVGESGAGKSMMALAVMGLLPREVVQTGGDIVLNHQPLSTLDADGRRRIRNREVAMILQNPMSAFDPVFKVGAHFRETLSSHGLAGTGWRRLAAQALSEVGLPDADALLNVYPFQMSGGMLQRVMIALALITTPTFLIADEATTDLDMVSQAQVLRILKERRKERHLGMLLITHDLSVAAYLADDIAVMRHGRLVESGPAEELFAHPKDMYTKQLLAAHHRLYGSRFEALRQRLAMAI